MTWLWVVLAAATAGPAGWAKLEAAERTALLQTLAERPMPERLLSISERFLKTPYVSSPLGEGEGQDPDPRVRFDAVDCLTFVEETMAMAMTLDEAKLLPTLDDIRYEKGVSFGARNHVMEAQWLPTNLKKGYLRDVTKEIGGAATKRVTKVLDDAAWASKIGKQLSLMPEQQAHGEFSLDIVPAQAALEKLKKAPDGTLIVVVRGDRANSVTRITHVGFLLHTKKGPFMRHASRTFGTVVDEDLSSYLGRNLGYAKWTVEGFSLYEIVKPAG